jgi:hypothetical protein
MRPESRRCRRNRKKSSQDKVGAVGLGDEAAKRRDGKGRIADGGRAGEWRGTQESWRRGQRAESRRVWAAQEAAAVAVAARVRARVVFAAAAAAAVQRGGRRAVSSTGENIVDREAADDETGASC